jgi:hypothetical protein
MLQDQQPQLQPDSAGKLGRMKMGGVRAALVAVACMAAA